MKLNITRQPLVPAFLTLLLLAVTVCLTAGSSSAAAIAAAPPMANTREISSADSASNPGITGSSHMTGWTDIPMALPLPRTALGNFEASHPAWARLLAGFLLLFAGLSIGRMTVRYNLYAVGTCLAIPLYGIVASGAAPGQYLLPTFAASAVLALAIKNFGRSFSNGYSFDATFRASFYAGLLPLLAPSALPLLLLLPVALALFRRTLREAAVALCGVLLPILALGYINWAAGGTLAAPAFTIGRLFLTGEPLALLPELQTTTILLLAASTAVCLGAALLFLMNVYIVGTKSRFVLVFNICTLALTLAILCGPAASRADIALLAVPAAVLMPLLLVRTRASLSQPLYLLLLAGAVAGILLQ